MMFKWAWPDMKVYRHTPAEIPEGGTLYVAAGTNRVSFLPRPKTPPYTMSTSGYITSPISVVSVTPGTAYSISTDSTADYALPPIHTTSAWDKVKDWWRG